MTFEALLQENQSLKKEILQSKEETFKSYNETTHLKEQVDELASVIENRDATIRTQENRINEMLKRLYGRKSEKLDSQQIVFDEIILDADKHGDPSEPIDPVVKEQIIQKHIRRSHPGRKPLPEHLERVEHYFDIDEKDKFTADGKERPMIGVDVY